MGNGVFKELSLWTLSVSAEKVELIIVSKMTQSLFINYRHQNTTLCLYSTCFVVDERTMTQVFIFIPFSFAFSSYLLY